MAITQVNSSWHGGQLVSVDDMKNFSNGIYYNLSQLTQNINPSILAINGTISQIGGDVDIPDGSFVFPNIIPPSPWIGTIAFAIFGNADANSSIPVTGNGWIVARYTLITAVDLVTISTSYIFITATPDSVTDCIVCVITAGIISAYGAYFINKAATNAEALAATATNVALVPANIPSFLANIITGIKASQPIGQLMQIDWGDASLGQLPGWIACQGVTLVNCISIYPDYWTYVGVVNPMNDNTRRGRPYKLNSTDVVMPNLEGVFLRGFNIYDANHASSGIGAVQFDEYLMHRHENTFTTGGSVGSGGSATLSSLWANTGVTTFSGGSETRPINIAFEIYTRVAYSI